MKINGLLEHSSKSKIYFCSDLHYNHLNVIRHGNRPFKSLEQMNNYILDSFKVLRSEDILFDLGDMFWNMGWQKVEEILKLIPCQIYKIMGNHDNEKLWRCGQGGEKLKPYLKSLADIMDIRIKNHDKEFMVSISHYPMLSWNHKAWGGVHIHGHTHGNLDNFNASSKDLRVDIGFDGELSRNYGSPIIPWDIIENYLFQKAGEQNFLKYVHNNINKELL